jgi:hypothetical protein
MTCSGQLRIGRSAEEWKLQRDSECRKGLELQRDGGCRKGMVLQRDSRYRKELELQRDSGCRKGLELQRDSRSGLKRNRTVCRMHSETRPVGKN